MLAKSSFKIYYMVEAASGRVISVYVNRSQRVVWSNISALKSFLTITRARGFVGSFVDKDGQTALVPMDRNGRKIMVPERKSLKRNEIEIRTEVVAV